LATKITRVQVARVMEESSPALTRMWDTDASVLASGGTYASCATAGSRMTVRFTGTSISVLGHKGSTGGNAAVFLDGVSQGQVSFYSAAQLHKAAVFSKTGLTNVAHVLVIQVLGTKPAGSTGADVDPDAFVVGTTTYQENSANVVSDFQLVSNTSASGGGYSLTYQDTDSSGAAYQFSFRGVGFTWYATKLPAGGKATVYVDGVKQSELSLYASSTRYRSAMYTSPTYTDKVHIVRIVANGVKPAGSAGTAMTLDSLTTR
jgi:hypothetical protein